MNKLSRLFFVSMLAAPMLSACSDDNDSLANLGPLTPEEQMFGKATGNFTAEEWYPGGQLGTTEKASYSAPAPAVTNQAGMEDDFIVGEGFFEKLYTFEQEPRKGLGPAWVRNSCSALLVTPAMVTASARRNIVLTPSATVICWSSIILIPMAISRK